MEPKSLTEIITEKEFLPLVQDISYDFFVSFNTYQVLLHNQEATRKAYSNLIQKAELLESFLDEHGARQNKTWAFFTEYVASIRNLVIAAFYTKHLYDRYPYYRLRDSEENREIFFTQSSELMTFLNKSIINLYEEVCSEGNKNGIQITCDTVDPDGFLDVEVNRQLPKNAVDDVVKEDEDRIIDLFEKMSNVARLMEEMNINKTDDPEKLKRLVHGVLDERMARHMMNIVHNIQSEFDTYIKNTAIEQKHDELKNFRGYISMPLHMLEVTIWLCHFYERHEDEIRQGECKRIIATLVNKNELLGHIINFCFIRCRYYIQQGDNLSKEILTSFIKNVRYELPIPTPLGFHARPSTYISLIVRNYEGEAFIVVDGEKYNAKSVMSLLQAGGLIADKGYTTVVIEGDKRILDDIKILAEHNYCEEKDIPDSLSYLKKMQRSQSN